MSERLPRLEAYPEKRRKQPSIQILRAYRDNKRRLLIELAKEPKDRWIRNNIHAYQHIIRWMEEEYDL